MDTIATRAPLEWRIENEDCLRVEILRKTSLEQGLPPRGHSDNGKLRIETIFMSRSENGEMRMEKIFTHAA